MAVEGVTSPLDAGILIKRPDPRTRLVEGRGRGRLVVNPGGFEVVERRRIKLWNSRGP